MGAVSRRCTGTLIGLSHVRHLVPRGVIITLVSALVLSQVCYCISVYGNGSKQNLARVQKILSFAAKVIFGRRKYDHATDLREKLGWSSFSRILQKSSLCIVPYVQGYPTRVDNSEGAGGVVLGNYRSKRRKISLDEAILPHTFLKGYTKSC